MKILKSRQRILKTSGQSLVEVIIALTVAVLVIFALVRVTVTSIRNANFAKNRALATKYAQEWIEDARRLRDELGDTFFDEALCSSADPETVDTVFTRTRTCNLSVEGDNKTMSVVVTVSWTDAVGRHDSRLETRLTNWK